VVERSCVETEKAWSRPDTERRDYLISSIDNINNAGADLLELGPVNLCEVTAAA